MRSHKMKLPVFGMAQSRKYIKPSNREIIADALLNISLSEACNRDRTISERAFTIRKVVRKSLNKVSAGKVYTALLNLSNEKSDEIVIRETAKLGEKTIQDILPVL